MASPQSSEKLASRLKVQMWDHDPGATTAQVVTPDGGTTVRYVDQSNYGCFMVMSMASTLTGNGCTLLEIVAADDATGTNATVIKTSGVVAPDAVGDYVFLECTSEEIRQESEDAGYDLRYVAGRITCANAADEQVVTYIQANPRFANSGLTANSIA